MRKVNMDEVRLTMARHGELSRIEASPAVQKTVAELFRANGWTPEEGKTPFQTLVDYAREAEPSRLNAQRAPLEEKLSQERVHAQLADRVHGLGTPTEVRKLIGQIQHHDVHDGLLERLTMKDFEDKGEGWEPSRETIDSSERHNLVRNAYEAAVRAPPTPAPAEAGAGTAHDSVRAAWDTHHGAEE